MPEYHHGEHVEVVVAGGVRDRELRAAGRTPVGEDPPAEDPTEDPDSDPDPDADNGE